MTPTPKVSVIMITYNQETTIDEAIRSVVKQRAPFPFELIVADDASTDSTPARAAEWQRRYPDIVKLVSRKKNLGLQHNFLDAWSRCRGEYIAICEGDDHWCSSRKLQRQARWLDEHPDCGLTFHRVVNHYADSRTMSLSNPHQQSDLTLADLARANVITNLSVMYRAIPAAELPDWLGEIKLFDYAFHSLHAARGTAHFLPWPMAVYRRYSGGIWSGDLHRSWHLALDVREHLMRHFRHTHPEAVANYLAAYRSIAIALLAATPAPTPTATPSAEVTPEDDHRQVRDRLKSIYLEFSGTPLTDQAIDADIAVRRPSSLSGKHPALSPLSLIRAAISRLLPVPRIP